MPASNAFNPFGQDVRATLALTGFGPTPDVNQTDFWRVVTGLDFDWGAWDGEISILGTQEASYSYSGNRLNAARFTAALASNDPAQAFNPFQDGPGGSPALLASLLDPIIHDEMSAEAYQIGGFVRGPLFSLPAGEVEIVLGGEARSEDVAFALAVSGIRLDASRSTEALFTELRAPLISPEQNVPFVERLVATGALRYDHYSDFGSTTNPEFGLLWNVAPDLLLRASWGTSFRPPSLVQLYLPNTALASQIADPLRNNQVSAITLLTGGNANLDPEEAEASSFGFQYTRDGPLRTRLGATAWRIEQDLRIQTLNQVFVASFPALFPGRVMREAPTPADILAGLPGQLVSIDITNVNFGSLETAGIDLEATGAIDTNFGEISFGATATWVDYYRVADIPGQAAVDRVGVANSMNTVPDWRVVATLGWRGEAASAALTARWTPSYADAGTTGAPNGADAPSQTLIDLDTSVDLEHAFRSPWSEGARLRLGVKNLFDEEPPFAGVGGTTGIDVSQADVRQRFVYLTLSKAF